MGTTLLNSRCSELPWGCLRRTISSRPQPLHPAQPLALSQPGDPIRSSVNKSSLGWGQPEENSPLTTSRGKRLMSLCP